MPDLWGAWLHAEAQEAWLCRDHHGDAMQVPEMKDYEELPESIKMLYTPKEWMWLGSEERGRAIERETMPDGPAE